MATIMVRRAVTLAVLLTLLSTLIIGVTMVVASDSESPQLIFQSERNDIKDLYLLDIERDTILPVTADAATDFAPAWSPNGEKIAYVTWRADHWTIALMSANGRDKHFLTPPDANYDSPAWSPDGSLLVFSSDRGGAWNIYTMRPDGSDVKQLTDTPQNDISPTWSADGRRIVFVSNRYDSQLDIYIMYADGSGVRRVTVDDESDGAVDWSPDGQRIVYMSQRVEKTDYCTTRRMMARCFLHGHLYTLDPRSGSSTRLTSKATSYWYPRWSPDGQWVAFAALSFRDRSIYRISADGSVLEQLTQTGNRDNYPAWRP